MEKNKSNNLTVSVICGILTAFGIVANIILLFSNSSVIKIFNIIDIVLALLISYYAFCGYRKPHGNFLKYLILIYSATLLIKIYLSVIRGDARGGILVACAIGLCCYVAGRLHKVKQNMILLGIVTIIIVIDIALIMTREEVAIGVFTPLIIWLDICAAYFLRYKEHRIAGLMDKE